MNITTVQEIIDVLTALQSEKKHEVLKYSIRPEYSWARGKTVVIEVEVSMPPNWRPVLAPAVGPA